MAKDLTIDEVIKSKDNEFSFVEGKGISIILNEEKINNNYSKTIHSAKDNLDTMKKSTSSMSDTIQQKIDETNSDPLAHNPEAINHLKEISNVKEYPVLINNTLNGIISDYLNDITKFNDQLRRLKKVAYYKKLLKMVYDINKKTEANTQTKRQYGIKTTEYHSPHTYKYIKSELKECIDDWQFVRYDPDHPSIYIYNHTSVCRQPWIKIDDWNLEFPHKSYGPSIDGYIERLKEALTEANAGVPAPPDDMD